MYVIYTVKGLLEIKNMEYREFCWPPLFLQLTLTIFFGCNPYDITLPFSIQPIRNGQKFAYKSTSSYMKNLTG